MADSQVTILKVCGHCLRGGLKANTDTVDVDKANEKDKTKTPARSPTNKPSFATKSAVADDEEEEKKTPAKIPANDPSPATESADEADGKEKKKSAKSLASKPPSAAYPPPIHLIARRKPATRSRSSTPAPPTCRNTGKSATPMTIKIAL